MPTQLKTPSQFVELLQKYSKLYNKWFELCALFDWMCRWYEAIRKHIEDSSFKCCACADEPAPHLLLACGTDVHPPETYSNKEYVVGQYERLQQQTKELLSKFKILKMSSNFVRDRLVCIQNTYYRKFYRPCRCDCQSADKS